MQTSCESVVTRSFFYTVVCWGSVKVVDANRLNQLIRMAAFVLGEEMDTGEGQEAVQIWVNHGQFRSPTSQFCGWTEQHTRPHNPQHKMLFLSKYELAQLVNHSGYICNATSLYQNRFFFFMQYYTNPFVPIFFTTVLYLFSYSHNYLCPMFNLFIFI